VQTIPGKFYQAQTASGPGASVWNNHPPATIATGHYDQVTLPAQPVGFCACSDNSTPAPDPGSPRSELLELKLIVHFVGNARRRAQRKLQINMGLTSAAAFNSVFGQLIIGPRH
jgi:hypothetical protein